jgi:hypothetical protein
MWLVLAEITAETRVGFMNVTTWADSAEVARSKIENYLNSFGWHLVSVEKADVIEEDAEYGEEVADMIDRTRNNGNAIILGTFHTYETN